MDRIQELTEYCEMHDHPGLECDGATRVFSWLLKQKSVAHIIMGGRIEYREPFSDRPYVMEPHYWIELDYGLVVDFKARMWFPGKEGVPHGIFMPSDYPRVLYVGQEQKGFLVCKTVFEILTAPREGEDGKV